MKVQELYMMVANSIGSNTSRTELLEIFSKIDPFPKLSNLEVESEFSLYTMFAFTSVDNRKMRFEIQRDSSMSLFRILYQSSDIVSLGIGDDGGFEVIAFPSIWGASGLSDPPSSMSDVTFDMINVRIYPEVKCTECKKYIPKRKKDEWTQRRCNTHTIMT